MRENGKIQQKPTTKHQAGKQDVNQAASPWLQARSGGEGAASAGDELLWTQAAQAAGPEQFPPSPGRKVIRQRETVVLGAHLLLPPQRRAL